VVGEGVPQGFLRMRRACCAGKVEMAQRGGALRNAPGPAGGNGASRPGRVAGPFAERVFPWGMRLQKGSDERCPGRRKPDNPRSRKNLSERQVEGSDDGGSPATYPEVVSATSYFFSLVALVVGGPPLYDPLLDFRWALASSLTSTTVPEVLESSLQPVSGRCEPMNSMRSRMRPRAKHGVLMLSPRRAKSKKGHDPRGHRVE